MSKRSPAYIMDREVRVLAEPDDQSSLSLSQDDQDTQPKAKKSKETPDSESFWPIVRELETTILRYVQESDAVRLNEDGELAEPTTRQLKRANEILFRLAAESQDCADNTVFAKIQEIWDVAILLGFNTVLIVTFLVYALSQFSGSASNMQPFTTAVGGGLTVVASANTYLATRKFRAGKLMQGQLVLWNQLKEELEYLHIDAQRQPEVVAALSQYFHYLQSEWQQSERNERVHKRLFSQDEVEPTGSPDDTFISLSLPGGRR